MDDSYEEEILRALRRITRAIDLHSRQLAHTFGLTAPQLVCLRTIATHHEITPGNLAKDVSLSQATITGIVDRLVSRQLVTRERSSKDRRVVTIRLTKAGAALCQQAPNPLQERFAGRLQELPADQQHAILDTLRRIVHMMDGEELDAAPVLTLGSAMNGEESTPIADDTTSAIPHVDEDGSTGPKKAG